MAATASGDRIESIDAIRGAALFGVLTVNLITEFRVSIFQQFVVPAHGVAGTDALVEHIVAVGLQGKAFCLFSLLFGVGLAIQFERLSPFGRPLYWLARRMTVLLAFGLVHLLLIWNGDILTEYAVAGFLVLPLLLLPSAWLLAIAFGFLVVYAVGPLLVYSIPWPDDATLRAHVAAAGQVYANGSLADTWRFSLAELPLILRLHAYAFPRTLALFLFGVLLWRAGILQRAAGFRLETALAAIAGIAAGAVLTATAPLGTIGGFLAPVVLALGYGAALLWIAPLPMMRRAVSGLAPVGRMAFSNYVAQSIVFAGIFFGYGLGQFGRMGAAPALVLGIAVFMAQIALSRWWLRRYRFGPIEWLWRTLMYGARQPMRRHAIATTT